MNKFIVEKGQKTIENKIDPAWVITNFPYIENEFDSATDYQLFSKVVEYLNNIIITINERDKYQNFVYSDIDPVGNVKPDFNGQLCLYTQTLDVYIAVDTLNSTWKKITN